MDLGCTRWSYSGGDLAAWFRPSLAPRKDDTTLSFGWRGVFFVRMVQTTVAPCPSPGEAAADPGSCSAHECAMNKILTPTKISLNS